MLQPAVAWNISKVSFLEELVIISQTAHLQTHICYSQTKAKIQPNESLYLDTLESWVTGISRQLHFAFLDPNEISH